MTVPEDDRLLMPWEVAEMCGVSPKTIGVWARAGRLRWQTTRGGHRRYRLEDVQAALERAES